MITKIKKSFINTFVLFTIVLPAISFSAPSISTKMGANDGKEFATMSGYMQGAALYCGWDSDDRDFMFMQNAIYKELSMNFMGRALEMYMGIYYSAKTNNTHHIHPELRIKNCKDFRVIYEKSLRGAGYSGSIYGNGHNNIGGGKWGNIGGNVGGNKIFGGGK